MDMCGCVVVSKQDRIEGPCCVSKKGVKAETHGPT